MKKNLIIIFIIFLNSINLFSDITVENKTDSNLKTVVYSQPKEAFHATKDEKELKSSESITLKNNQIKSIETKIEKDGKWQNVNINHNDCLSSIEEPSNDKNLSQNKKIVIKHDPENNQNYLACS